MNHGGSKSNTMVGRAAIVVLARSPRVEAQLKSLDRSGAGAGSRLFDASLRRTLRAARGVAAADLHVAVAPEDRKCVRGALRSAGATRFLQSGDTFGDRVANAVARLRASGYERVVVVAGDCPGIGRRHVIAAVAALSTRSVVLGPSGDGGLYLLGLDAAALNRFDLRSVPWLTHEVVDAMTRGAAEALLPLARLERLDDVDGPRSVVFLLRGLGARTSSVLAGIVSFLREALRTIRSPRRRAALVVAHHVRDVAILWRRPPPQR